MIKFQKYKDVTQNGIVNDHVWSLMLAHANNIINEAKKMTITMSSGVAGAGAAGHGGIPQVASKSVIKDKSQSGNIPPGGSGVPPRPVMASGPPNT